MDAAQVDADVSESLFLLSAPSGGGIHPRFPRRVIAGLVGSVEHAVRNLVGSDADGPDDAALWVADALDRLRSDGDVSGPGALEGNFRALLVAGRNLDAIWRTVQHPLVLMSSGTGASTGRSDGGQKLI